MAFALALEATGKNGRPDLADGRMECIQCAWDAAAFAATLTA